MMFDGGYALTVGGNLMALRGNSNYKDQLYEIADEYVRPGSDLEVSVVTEVAIISFNSDGTVIWAEMFERDASPDGCGYWVEATDLYTGSNTLFD